MARRWENERVVRDEQVQARRLAVRNHVVEQLRGCLPRVAHSRHVVTKLGKRLLEIHPSYLLKEIVPGHIRIGSMAAPSP